MVYLIISAVITLSAFIGTFAYLEKKNGPIRLSPSEFVLLLFALGFTWLFPLRVLAELNIIG